MCEKVSDKSDCLTYYSFFHKLFRLVTQYVGRAPYDPV